MPDMTITPVATRPLGRKALGLGVICACVALAVVAAAPEGDDARSIRVVADLPEKPPLSPEAPGVSAPTAAVPPPTVPGPALSAVDPTQLEAFGITLAHPTRPASVTQEQAVAIALGKTPGTVTQAVLADVEDTQVVPQIHQLMWVVVVKWSHPMPSQGAGPCAQFDCSGREPLGSKEYVVNFVDANTGEWVQGIE